MPDLPPSVDMMFPHIVEPRPGEWLPGVLLRCDVVNEWVSGTAARIVAENSYARNVVALPQYVVNTVLRLDILATTLGVPQEAVRHTTFREEIMQFAATRHPHISQFGDPVPFGICPACVAAGQMLQRSLALPYLTTCLTHGFQIQRTCRCGAALAPFQDATPFTCGTCGVPWTHLPQIQGTGEEVQRDRYLGEVYDVIWRRGSPAFTLCVWRLVEDAMTQRGYNQMILLDGKVRSLGSVNPIRISVSFLVLILGSLGFPATWLETATQPPVVEELHCRNERCPQYGVRMGGTIRLAAERAGSPIWFCTECGSRFTAHYLLATSELPVGERPPWEYPTPAMIEGEAQKITRWHVQLEEVCQLLTQDRPRPMHLDEMFRQAGISPAEWVLAPRLGLREVVVRYQQHQVEQRCATYHEEVTQTLQQLQMKRGRGQESDPMEAPPFRSETLLLEDRIGMLDDIVSITYPEEDVVSDVMITATLRRIAQPLEAEDKRTNQSDEDQEDAEE